AIYMATESASAVATSRKHAGQKGAVGHREWQPAVPSFSGLRVGILKLIPRGCRDIDNAAEPFYPTRV
nr:hypothetical protein [Streptomyces sp. DSM 41633]